MQPGKMFNLVTEFRDISAIWKYIVYRAYIARKLAIRRSSFGFFFEPVMLLLSTFCIAIVWYKLFGKGAEQEFSDFFVYVLVSFCIWNLISSLVGGLTGSLVSRAKTITNTTDPIMSGVLIDLISHLIVFMFNIPVVLFVVFILTGVDFLGLLYLLYGIALILITGLGLGLILGIGCLFVGDLRAVVNSIMRVAFLLTPIVWHVERLGEYQPYIFLNPFYSYLAVCRDGILGGTVGTTELVMATCITILVLLLGLLTLACFKTKLRAKAFSL